MADNKIDIEIVIKDEKAKLALQKISVAAKELEEREKRTRLQTENLASSLNNKLANAAALAGEKQRQAALKTQLLENRLKKATEQTGLFSTAIGKISIASFIGNLTSRAVTAGINTITNGFNNIVMAGRDFEDGLVAVGKTTGISGDRLTDLGNTITDISRKIPVATKDLLEIATVAGQLGLKSANDITTFTETIGKLQLATDIAGEEGSQSVARILTITGELEKNGSLNIVKFGNVITELGNNFAATESQILTVANEVAKGTAAFEVSSEDVLGLATAFKATGSEAETSGSAIQRVFTNIAAAAQNGGDDLAKFAKAANVTGEEFQKLFEEDPTQAFLQLAKGIGENSKTGGDLADTLKSLGLGSLRVSKALTPLIARYGTLEKAISDARTQAEEKNALDIEAAKAADTLSGDIKALSNSFAELSKEIFKSLGPALRLVVQSVTAFNDVLTALLDRKVLIGIAGGLSAITIALVALNIKTLILAAQGIPALVVAIGNLAVATTIATGGLNLLIPALFAVGAATALYVDSLGDAARETKQLNENAVALSDAYEELDEDSQTFLDSLNELTQGMERGDGVNQLYTKSVKGINDNLVELKRSQSSIIQSNEELNKSTERRGLFEQDKLKLIKKFFKEEEQLKLQAKFSTIENEKEQEAFSKFVASQGKRRQEEAFKATIGLDKATLDAKREYAARLKEIRSAQGEFEQEQQQKELQRLEQLRQKQNEALLAESVAKSIAQDEDIEFKDEELARITKFLDEKSKAEFAYREANAKDEIAKNQLLADARKKAAEQEIKQRERAKAQSVNLERQKQQLTLGFAQAGATALFQIAGANNKALFALNKAFAIADVIIKGIQAEQLTLAQFGPFIGAPLVAGIKANTGIQLATIAATAIGQVASGNFEQGGIVPGNSFTGDRVQANVNSGEMILNRQQQSQLFSIANGGGSMAKEQQPIVINTTVEVDNEAIGYATSKWVANGGQLGEVQ